MKRLLAATLALIALHALPLTAQASEFAQSFYHNAVFRDFAPEDVERVTAALDAIVETLESEEFRQTVLNFKDKDGNVAFLENNGFSNEQIYQVILDGAEKLRPSADRTMDMDITWYYSWKNTIGYTYPNSPRIWVNSKYYSKYDTASMTRNLFHEWLHKLGFGHTSGTENRPWTVPYGLGAKMEKLVRARLQQ